MASIRFILYVITIYGCTGCRLEIEAEHGTSTGGVQRHRSQASNGITVLINTQRHNIIFPMEVANTTCNPLTVTDVRYSNDGLSDVVSVFLNTSKIGQFTSKAVVTSGDGWNDFRSSGQVGNPVQIHEGVYKLQIQLSKSSDEYGIEIDKVSLQFNCSSVNVNNECPESVIKVDGGSITGSTATTDTATTDSTATTGGTEGDNSPTKGLSLVDIFTIIGSIGTFLVLAVGVVGVIITTHVCCSKKKSKCYKLRN